MKIWLNFKMNVIQTIIIMLYYILDTEKRNKLVWNGVIDKKKNNINLSN